MKDRYEDEDEDYYPPMADKPCDQPQLCATYYRGWCTECGYPGNCHIY